MSLAIYLPRGLLAVAAVLGWTATVMTSTPAQAKEKAAALVFDANSGRILLDENGSARRHPASLTKMMTLYMLFEALESGRTSMNSRIRVSGHAASAPPSKLNLKPGDHIAVSDAIRALVTKSANDVARAVAEHVGGTEANFVRLMNARARDMGMSKTHFTNPSGLPDIKQISTARDMITLALRLQEDFPKYYPLFKTGRFSYRGKSYRNHNTLLRTYSGVDGIKTGYIRMSGFNVVTNLRRGKRHVVAAVFGGATAAKRNAKMRRILNATISRAATRKTWRLPRPQPAIAHLKQSPRKVERPRVAANVVPPRRRPETAQRTPERIERKPFVRASVAPAKAARPIEAANPPVSSPPVQVYKVRRVAIAPTAATTTEPVRYTADEVSDTIINSDDPIGALAELHTAKPVAAGFMTPTSGGSPSREYAVASLNETIVPKRSGVGSRNDRRPFAVAALQPSQVPVATRHSNRVPQPPTIQRSARVAPIAESAPSRRQPPARLAPVTTPAVTSGYLVQVGAYASESDARNALHGLQQRAANLLSNAAPMTERVASGGKTLFRARFGGFDAASASQTCSELRRRAVDCFVTASK